jgi:hypothetical protein
MKELRKLIKVLICECLSEQKNIKDNLNDNFWKWFGNSKIKKGNEPIILYHGTKTNFNIFRPSKSVGNQGEKDQIEGIYFTTNKDAASFFSIGEDERYLKSVYLSIKNPYFTEGNNELKDELGIDKLADANEALKKMGYDGLIMKRGFYAYGGPYVLYLAFYSNQIKSINNDGTWNIGNNDIYS